MLIINGQIYTMEGPVFNPGYVRFEGDKISGCGSMSDIGPENESETVDARGGFVLPGLIDAHCHLGMFGNALGFEGDDGNEDTNPCTPHLRALDAVNPFDRCFEDAYRAGVTSVLTGPGSANPVGGQFIAVKTAGRYLDDMVIKAPVCIKFALGENPKTVYHTKSEAPVTRMATAAIIREALFKAKEYMEKRSAAKYDPEKDAPDFDIKLESLIPLLKGDIKAHFHAHRADDIMTAVRISKEFGLKYAIVHGTEGHLIADILKREGAAVISGPSLTDRAKPELSNQTPSSPGILSSAGIPTAICTDHPETPVQYLTLCAAIAVKAGMSEMDALSSITINAAKIAGIDDRVGSIKPGKDADIVVFSENPLSFYAEAETVVVDGRIVSRRF